MTDFLIQTSEPHTQLILAKSEDMISIHTNCRTLMLSTSMGEEIMKGLMALLKGGFDRALSETSLRMEEEETTRRNNRALPSGGHSPPRSGSAPIPPTQTELDQL